MPSSDRTRRHALSARSIVHPRSGSRPALSGRSRTRSGSSREPRRRRLLEFRVGLYSQRFDRDELFRPAVLNVFELVAFAKVRFCSRLRIIGRLGQQRDVVLLDDAEPHAVAIELTLLAYGDPAGSGTSEVIFMASRVWSLCGAPGLQPVAIAGKSAAPRKPQKQAKSVATGRHRLPETFHGKQGVCRGLPPVAGGPLPEKEGVDPRPVERWIQAGATNVTFGRSAWPLPLSTFRVDRSWEGQPASNVQQRLR